MIAIACHPGTCIVNISRAHHLRTTGTLDATSLCMESSRQMFRANFPPRMEHLRTRFVIHIVHVLYCKPSFSRSSEEISPSCLKMCPSQVAYCHGRELCKQSNPPTCCRFIWDNVYIAETKAAAGIGGALLAQFACWRENYKSDGTFEKLGIEGQRGRKAETSCGTEARRYTNL